MHRVAAVLLLVALGGACTKTEVGDDAGEGSVAVGTTSVPLDDVECAEPGGTLYAAGAAVDGARVVAFDAAVAGGTAELTVRTLRDDEVEGVDLGTELTARRDGADVTVTGSFTSFEGPTQTGEVDGTVTFSCAPDTDPGGGTLSLEGQSVSYDLVTCLETDGTFEARARDTADPDQALTLRRTLLRSGWVDRSEVTGSVQGDGDRALDTGEGAAVDPEGGLFTVRGTRVTGEGELFGPGRIASVDLTCGIDLDVTDAG